MQNHGFGNCLRRTNHFVQCQGKYFAIMLWYRRNISSIVSGVEIVLPGLRDAQEPSLHFCFLCYPFFSCHALFECDHSFVLIVFCSLQPFQHWVPNFFFHCTCCHLTDKLLGLNPTNTSAVPWLLELITLIGIPRSHDGVKDTRH